MALDVNSIIGSLVGNVMQNPETLTSLMEHPYSAVREASGEAEVSREEVAQVLTGVSGLANGQEVDFGNLASLASGLLAQNNGSAHDLASSLFGLGGTAAATAESGAAASVVNPDLLTGLAQMVQAGGVRIPGVDLSDGLGLDDLIGFATNILGGGLSGK